jgi:hypothetical protein
MEFSWQAIRRPAYFAAVLVVMGAVTGCGGKGTVTGAVTGPDGQPLPAGRITFAPASGSPGVTGEIQDGKYTVENVPTGENKVAVETEYIQVENGMIVKNAASGKRLPGTGMNGPPPKDAPPAFMEMQKKQEEGINVAKEKLAKYRKIDDKFTDPKTSGFSLTVKTGTNTFPVDLSKK